MVPRGTHVGTGSRLGVVGRGTDSLPHPAFPPISGPLLRAPWPRHPRCRGSSDAADAGPSGEATASPPGDTGKWGLPSHLGAAVPQEANPVPLSRAARGLTRWPAWRCLLPPASQVPRSPTPSGSHCPSLHQHLPGPGWSPRGPHGAHCGVAWGVTRRPSASPGCERHDDQVGSLLPSVLRSPSPSAGEPGTPGGRWQV